MVPVVLCAIGGSNVWASSSGSLHPSLLGRCCSFMNIKQCTYVCVCMFGEKQSPRDNRNAIADYRIPFRLRTQI
uniref:Putative secreted protein n=1 Tax=Anopheles triannulatus TaxID=58253 RepID=A0A2M4B6S7_9DIPT